MGPGSSPGRRGENSCFIFPRAGVMRVCVLAARRARAVAIVGPLETQRAQGKPGARCTRGLACNVHREHAHEHTGSAESIRPSLRNGFTAYSALSSVTGLFATVASQMNSRDLTPASGRQDHTSSPYA